MQHLINNFVIFIDLYSFPLIYLLVWGEDEMKKLMTLWMTILVLALMSGNAFPQAQYIN